VSLRVRRRRSIPNASDDAFSYAVAMVIVPVLFGLLGSWIDGRLGTHPLFLLALGAFGVACSFASAYYRYEARISHHDEGKPWTRHPRPADPGPELGRGTP
jgi:MFS family permease